MRVRARPGIQRCIQLAFTLGFIHTHFSHRDGAASARARSQPAAHALPLGTHGCERMANISLLPMDITAGFKFEDEDLSTQRRSVRRESRERARAWHIRGEKPPRAHRGRVANLRVMLNGWKVGVADVFFPHCNCLVARFCLRVVPLHVWPRLLLGYFGVIWWWSSVEHRAISENLIDIYSAFQQLNP